MDFEDELCGLEEEEGGGFAVGVEEAEVFAVVPGDSDGGRGRLGVGYAAFGAA